MTIEEGFERIFENAFFIMDSKIKDCESFKEINLLGDCFDHNFIHELINWFAENYNVDILGIYHDYLKKCYDSFIDRINQFIAEDN